jgi:hypothetical protein
MTRRRSFVSAGITALFIVASAAVWSSQAAENAAIAAPQWQPGYECEYRWRSARGEGTFVRTVEREAVEDAVPVWVIDSGDREELHRKDDLAYYEEKRGGEVDSSRDWSTGSGRWRTTRSGLRPTLVSGRWPARHSPSLLPVERRGQGHGVGGDLRCVGTRPR